MLLGLSALYGVNRFILLPRLAALVKSEQGTDLLYRLISSYGADVLAGAWILCFLNLILVWSGRKPVHRIAPAMLFVLGCGIFWEYVTPLYLSRSVGDPLDIAAYLAGCCVYLIFEKYRREKYD